MIIDGAKRTDLGLGSEKVMWLMREGSYGVGCSGSGDGRGGTVKGYMITWGHCDWVGHILSISRYWRHPLFWALAGDHTFLNYLMRFKKTDLIRMKL